MSRTVKVGLDVDEKSYVRGVERAEKATDKLDSALGDVSGSAKDTAAGMGAASEAIDDTAGSARSAGKALDGLTRDAQRLDRQIDETARGVRDLAREIARTSDAAARADLTVRLNAKRGELRGLTDLRRLGDFGGAGAQGAEEFSLGFAGRIGPLMARAPLSPGLVAGVAGAAPLVANVLSGAVVGGIATGVAGIGVAIAAQDAQVQSAAKGMAGEIGNALKDAAKPFVPATIGAIGIVRAEFRDMQGDLEDVFEDASEYVKPLTRAAVGFGRAMLPGIRDAVREAEPFFSMLERELPELGQDVGELFSTMAEHAEDGAEAVGQMVDLLGAAADTTGLLIDGLAAVKKYTDLDVGGEPGTHWSDKTFGNMAKKMVEIKPAGEAAASGALAAAAAAGTLEERAEATLDDLRAWREELDGVASSNLSAKDAQIGLESAIDDAAAALEENGKTAIRGGSALDINSEAGRKNASALYDIAEQANQTYDEVLALTGSEYEAAEAAGRGRDKFLEFAQKMGLSKEAAFLLADQLFKIPAHRDVRVRVDTAAAMARAKAISDVVNGIRSKNITIGVYYVQGGRLDGSLKVPGGTQLKNRWGGVYEHAQDGLINLREAAVYSPQGPARYAFAEPATGGEAFIPKNGDRDRSMGILEQAANWYGASLQPYGASLQPMYASGGGGGTVRIEATLRWPNGDLAGQLVYDGFMGSPKAMTGFRKAVGRAGGNPKVLDR